MTDRVERILQGDIRVASQFMRDLDDRVPGAVEVFKQLYPNTGGAYVVGITGNPGVGKSTLVNALTTLLRARGARVGVIAVDPTSPFSGGAILGDRIRMQQHALDPGVFIRSLATRGQLGGVSRSTFDVVCVVDAMGFDYIFVETVGVGQDELDVMRIAHTTVVVTVPGLGDDIQALKAGLMEIADILVVNKADREGAHRTVRDLQYMLGLRASQEHVDVIETVASENSREGANVEQLVAAITRHRRSNSTDDKRVVLEQRRANAYVMQLIRESLVERAEAAMAGKYGDEHLVKEVARRVLDPYSAVERMLPEG